MLLNEIIKDLSKDLETSKQAIAACCVAEKNMQRLLDTVNESMSINDIRNCYEVIEPHLDCHRLLTFFLF